MARKRRRRKTKVVGQMLSDLIFIFDRLPWWGALLGGLALWLLIDKGFAPIVDGASIVQLPSSNGGGSARIMTPVGRMVHWLGNACLFIGVFFAVKNLLWSPNLSAPHSRQVAKAAKIFGRSQD